MASKNKITDIIAAIKTIYPYYARDTDIATLVKTWGILLKDFPDDMVDVALYMSLQTCKNPPTPADLIEKLNAMSESAEPSDEELWGVLTTALRKADWYISRFSGTFIEENGRKQGENARRGFEKLWEGLPEKIQMYLGGQGEFQRLAQNRDSEELKFERTRFLKAMPTMQKRSEYKRLTLALEAGTATGLLPE